MTPPPNTTSPSYHTTDCPGVTDFTGSANFTSTLSSSSGEMMTLFANEVERIFACASYGSFSESMETQFSRDAISSVPKVSSSKPTVTVLVFASSASTYSGRLAAIFNPRLCPIVKFQIPS